MGIFSVFVGASLALAENGARERAYACQQLADLRNAERASWDLVQDTVLSHSAVYRRLSPTAVALWDAEVERAQTVWEAVLGGVLGGTVGSVLAPGLGTIIGFVLGLLAGAAWMRKHAIHRINSQFAARGYDVSRLMATLEEDHRRQWAAYDRAVERTMFPHM